MAPSPGLGGQKYKKRMKTSSPTSFWFFCSATHRSETREKSIFTKLETTESSLWKPEVWKHEFANLKEPWPQFPCVHHRPSLLSNCHPNLIPRCSGACVPASLSPCVIVLRLSVFLLFLPDAIHPKTSVFTKLGTALWTGMNHVLETVQYKWYPHTTVASEKKKPPICQAVSWINLLSFGVRPKPKKSHLVNQTKPK